MSEHTKNYTDLKSLLEASDAMDEFQLLHNLLRDDYIALLRLTEQYVASQIEFNTLYNSCLIRLFTMIEADLFGLGKLDPYPKTKPKENFYHQFSNTFNQISKTWDKEDIKEKYFKNYFADLMEVKDIRNSLVHPGKVADIQPATVASFLRVKTAFDNYNGFMAGIANQFFIGIDGSKLSQAELDEIIKRKEARGLRLNKHL